MLLRATFWADSWSRCVLSCLLSRSSVSIAFLRAFTRSFASNSALFLSSIEFESFSFLT